MKKRLFLLACIMILIMCGCGKEKDDGSLSNDWSDMQFTLNDSRYELPCEVIAMDSIIEIDVSENMDMIFGSIADSATTISANSVSRILGKFKNSECLVTMVIVNDTDKMQSLKDCMLVGLIIKANLSYDKSNSEWSSDAPDILVAGGSSFGMTFTDVTAAYGEPDITDTFENKHGVTGSIYYTVTDKENVVKYLRFGIYKNMLNEIELMCEEYIK